MQLITACGRLWLSLSKSLYLFLGGVNFLITYVSLYSLLFARWSLSPERITAIQQAHNARTTTMQGKGQKSPLKPLIDILAAKTPNPSE